MVLEIKHIRLKKTAHTLLEQSPPVIRVESFDSEYVEVEDVWKMREANLELSEGKKFFAILDTSKGYAHSSPEDNKLMASREFAELRIATALIARSLPAKMLSNFFIRVNKPHTPTKVFMNEDEAMQWFKTFGVNF